MSGFQYEERAGVATVCMTLDRLITMALDVFAGEQRDRFPYIDLNELFLQLKRNKAIPRGDSKRQMNRALDRLVKKGVIVRRQDRLDRRPKYAIEDAARLFEHRDISMDPQSSNTQGHRRRISDPRTLARLEAERQRAIKEKDAAMKATRQATEQQEQEKQETFELLQKQVSSLQSTVAKLINVNND
jgi:hypothetical protein